MKLRPYKNKDVITLVNILSSLRDTNLKSIIVSESSAVSNDSGEPDYDRVGSLIVDVLSECWLKLGDKLIDWLADMNEMTTEDFLNADESIIDTIEEIATRKESRDFFSRLWSLFKMIKS